ncbi:bifunctional salicylyl-CoA 5-hydroxylase/oxidoreductase [Sphingomonas daechungensis]|uniref:Bifunctional salicylyl-CoA 5-hydroxylase/oxidoreductase n=1 Tax=Sphingomonas daechungensis TaxID=1176646 RepID=A0ABX6T382_9SPHN|nr:bifunctional salicylyl-CoA 5-hydroxylase/oxidoreductase [Sphingomonas daechungensis]QNP43889.1 bifunctional salicylyl-CoA 5-hydroxylase/oxidoreductase [Sphingomonas daechungensis]
MRIACVGAGPAGLYFAISMKLRDPSHDVTVFERNAPGVTFGWGVVFSDQTVENLQANDPKSAKIIADEFAHWDDIDVHIGGETITSSGHGFIGIGRKRLLEILQDRARELGVTIEFNAECDPADPKWRDYDLVIASDGINSRFRDAYEDAFGVDVDVRANKFVWLGTRKVFDAFTFAFEETEHGWIWAHAYRFAPDCSTFIVECSENTWRKFGFDRMDQAEAIAVCEKLFAKYLYGHSLMSNAAHLRGSAAWLNFRRIKCERWSAGNVILLGDAAHTAHFSVGSGTKLALEDAIKLADVLNRPGLSLEAAMDEYVAERNLEVLKLQNSARNSTEWFETLERYTHFEPLQFAYSLLTRSQRISHENLRLRDREWLEGAERWFWKRATDGRSNKTAPPMFAPFKLREMTLENRITVSPMAMYSAVDGTPNDFHFVHYGERAMGGAGLVFTEMTCVSPEGRISPGCTGMWSDEHVAAWKRIVDFVHGNSKAKICLQLGHSGAKGSTRVGWEEDNAPLPDGNWPIMAASDVAWSPVNQVPTPMSRKDMDEVRDQFVAAVRMALDVNFDMIELHAAHGYLLSGFLTPLQNKRTDEYGGSLENRLRYPLEVFTAMRDAWPSDRPMSVRISATDWAGDQGITPDEAVEIADAFARAGADLIDVSAGQTWTGAQPVYGRMFQTPFSDKLRNEARLATMAVGNIYEPDHANSILAAGRADLVALARPHLIDPFWTLRAAAQLGYRDVHVPPQYLNGMSQLARNLKREAEMAAALRV